MRAAQLLRIGDDPSGDIGPIDGKLLEVLDVVGEDLGGDDGDRANRARN